MASRSSTVEKGAHIKPALLGHNRMQYNSLNEEALSDPKDIEELVRMIETLDKYGHEQIYMGLRKTKPKTFFAANNTDTRFNIYGLNTYERQNLKRIVNLCQEDMERKKVLEIAKGDYNNELMQLDKKLSKRYDEESTDLEINPPEEDKIKHMLKMNNQNN